MRLLRSKRSRLTFLEDSESNRFVPRSPTSSIRIIPLSPTPSPNVNAIEEAIEVFDPSICEQKRFL